MLALVIELFVIAFLVNLAWEISHSTLYTTCHRMKLNPYVRLILTMSLKDAFWITLFYGGTVSVFQNSNILTNNFQLSMFVALGLGFAFIDEKISVSLKRWEYMPAMPRMFGVGITPLLEIAVTGVISFFLLFH